MRIERNIGKIFKIFCFKKSWTTIFLFFVAAYSHGQEIPTLSMGAPPKDAAPPKAVTIGPYTVSVATEKSLPTHTVYRPADMSVFDKNELPIIAWGNGGCISSGRAFENFLIKVASHGFVIIAIGPDDVAPPDLSGLKPGDPLPPLPPSARSTASQLIDGIDWALAQNNTAGSPYKNKLDAKSIAVMGQSCGGLQAIVASADPRVKTSVIWNSGVFNGEKPFGEARKEHLKNFHSPVAYFIGGPSDIAYENAEDDFKRIDGVPLFNANLNVGHGGTFRQENGGWFGEVGTAWLLWQLKGDDESAKLFSESDCGLCSNDAWNVKKKNM